MLGETDTETDRHKHSAFSISTRALHFTYVKRWLVTLDTDCLLCLGFKTMINDSHALQQIIQCIFLLIDLVSVRVATKILRRFLGRAANTLSMIL